MDLSGTSYPQGNTGAGPLNVTIYLTATPMRSIVANLSVSRRCLHHHAVPGQGSDGPGHPDARAGRPGAVQPLSVPGRIEAEDYDLGGFSDTTPGNAGGAYRHDEVDIETAGGVTNVGWIRNGEWLTYTVNITQAGNYTVTARTASPNSGRTMALSVDGVPAVTIAVPNTGSFETYRDATPPLIQITATQTPITGVTGVAPSPHVTLPAGTHTLKLTFSGDGQNLDWFELTPFVPPTPTPLPPTPNGSSGQPYPAPHAVPGRVESEDYNVGGFSDTTAANEGGAYRQDAVDIERGGSNYNVGWIRAGEYPEYPSTRPRPPTTPSASALRTPARSRP